MAARTAATLALVALLAGCGSGHRPSAVEPATTIRGPGFLAAPGWHVLGYGFSQPPDAPEASVANVQFAATDRSEQSPPSRTVASLPREGVVIWALLSPRWGPVDDRFPVKRLPLRVGEAVATAPPEGFSARGAVRRLDARVAGYDVSLSVFFGAKNPSAAAIAAANRALTLLFFPGCPPDAERLGPGDPAAAARATYEWLRSHYLGQKRDLRGASFYGRVVPARSTFVPLQAVEQLCGSRTDRIVEVAIKPPKVGRQQLGPRLLYFTAKTRRGWLVWYED